MVRTPPEVSLYHRFENDLFAAMNRETVALGTPVFTIFEGRVGAVDERLLSEGRLRRLADPDQLRICKRAEVSARSGRIRRDPGLLVDLLSSG